MYQKLTNVNYRPIVVTREDLRQEMVMRICGKGTKKEDFI